MPAVTTERDEYVGIVRIDDPDTRNALSRETMTALAEACKAFDADADVRAILIAGGDVYFASSADVRAMRDPSYHQAMAAPTTAFWSTMQAIETPLVAGVSGYALGTGFELALICDMIVASENAELGQPEILLGMIPGGGATQRLTRVLGKQRAMELVLTGRRLVAADALAWGLVNQVARKKEWYTDALEVARFLARRSPIAVKLGKAAVKAADEVGLADGLVRERVLYEQAMATEDRIEGIDAFLEKRQGRFTGR